MQFFDPHGFNNAQTGKYVRFKHTHAAENFNLLVNKNPQYPKLLRISRGDIGLIYKVNGATLFIAFADNLKLAPSRNLNVTRHAAHITLTIDDIAKIEIEL